MDKVERAGTGIRRMKEAMAAAELPPPKIRQTGFYTIVFKRPAGIGGDRVVEKLVDRLVERLAESQKTILKLIKENPYISKKELSEAIGISTTAVVKNITRLKKEGLLKRIGPDKGGHWEIVKD